MSIKRNGFTLIELLVTIAIITLLMAISIFGLSGARESARDGRRKSDLDTIRSALELFKSDCNAYPASITFGNSLPGINNPVTFTTCLTTYTYMQSIPRDPGSASYVYRQISTSTYELCSTLEKPGSGATCGTGGTCSCSGSTSCGSGTCRYRVTNP